MPLRLFAILPPNLMTAAFVVQVDGQFMHGVAGLSHEFERGIIV